MDLYLLAITITCLFGTYGFAQPGRPRYRRQSPNSKSVFTCPALFEPTGTGAVGEETIRPPTFSDCPPANLAGIYHVPTGAQGAVVTWTEPTASDKDGFLLSPVVVRGNVSGSTFHGSVGGRRHDIVYLATDTRGLAVNCHFSFNVTVGSCVEVQWPVNGDRVCSDNNVLGSVCTYSCNSGYQLSGPTTVTCQNNNHPQWSQIPVCEKVTCGTPPTLSHGSVECTGTDYLSTCTYSCHDGFSLQDHVLIKCQSTGTWSIAPNTKCKDILPPNISCLSPQTFYADRGLTSTSVNWAEPIVTDNSGATLAAVKTSGPDQHTVTAAGTSLFVKYKATDDEGNESPECAIELRVQVIFCGPPSETFHDSNLTFSCMLTNYRYGDRCSLACLRNFPLVGSHVITCERNNTGSEPSGYWVWGNGNQPSCNYIMCPNFDPPRHGYFEEDSVSGDPILQLKCNSSDYNIPDMGTLFAGLFSCHSGIGWRPYFPKTPDCVVPRTAVGFALDSEILYYGGNCTHANLTTFRTKFQEMLNIATTRFQTVCPSNTNCSATEPQLSCTTSRRKRRSERHGAIRPKRDTETLHSVARRQTASRTLLVSFYINAYFDLSNMPMQQIYNHTDEIQLNKLKPIIQSMVIDGSFNMPSWTIGNDSFQTSKEGDVACDPGYQHRRGFICQPCPAGYFLNKDKCEICSIGFYAGSASFSCTHCPRGYSTKRTGCELIANCTKYCSKGLYSPDGLEPCSPCPRGFYNPNVNGTSCMPCPLQTSTVWSGSSNATDCQEFDVQLDGTGTYIDVANVQFETHFTFSVWMKKLSHKMPNATLKIRTDSIDIVELHISNNIRVTSVLVGLNKDIGEISSDTWVQVTAAVDLQGKQVLVYYNGVQTAVTHNTQATDISHSRAILSVSSTGNTGIRISGLRLYGKLATQSDVTSCHHYETTDLANMGVFKNINIQGITLETPSTCNVADHCRDKPCGSHTCLNKDGGFTCVCNNNWSGRTCSTPPDYCVNNKCENHASCLNGQGNYSCVCHQGYSGPLCEISPVDGRWSLWSQWTECTVTCSSGTRERTRACSSPEPGAFGQNCTGVSKQTQRCNTSPCPECSKSGIDTREDLRCTPDNDNGLSCSIECHTGYSLPKELLDHRFRCGLATGYRWLPEPNLPVCLTPIGPQLMTLTYRVTYSPAVSITNEQKFRDSLEAAMTQADCRVNRLCDIHVKAEYKSSDSDFTTVRLSFEATLSDDKPFDYRRYLLNGTVSAGLQELMNNTAMLEATATWIHNSAPSVFDVNLNGNTYTAQVSEAHGTVTCDQGHTPINCFCGACPAGAYLNGSMCRFCDKGSYQPEEGQTQCLGCPTGFTTTIVGSVTHSDCTVPVTTGITKSKLYDEKTSDTGNTATYIGATVAGVGVLTAIVVGVICCKIRRHSGQGDQVAGRHRNRPLPTPQQNDNIGSTSSGAHMNQISSGNDHERSSDAIIIDNSPMYDTMNNSFDEISNADRSNSVYDTIGKTSDEIPNGNNSVYDTMKNSSDEATDNSSRFTGAQNTTATASTHYVSTPLQLQSTHSSKQPKEKQMASGMQDENIKEDRSGYLLIAPNVPVHTGTAAVSNTGYEALNRRESHSNTEYETMNLQELHSNTEYEDMNRQESHSNTEYEDMNRQESHSTQDSNDTDVSRA